MIRTGVVFIPEIFVHELILSTIRTGVVFISGFLHMGSFYHHDVDYPYSRYIAPLMANFDTNDSDSDILYRDDGTLFFHIQ